MLGFKKNLKIKKMVVCVRACNHAKVWTAHYPLFETPSGYVASGGKYSGLVAQTVWETGMKAEGTQEKVSVDLSLGLQRKPELPGNFQMSIE